jgi:hypothetical protein
MVLELFNKEKYQVILTLDVLEFTTPCLYKGSCSKIVWVPKNMTVIINETRFFSGKVKSSHEIVFVPRCPCKDTCGTEKKTNYRFPTKNGGSVGYIFTHCTGC